MDDVQSAMEIINNNVGGILDLFIDVTREKDEPEIWMKINDQIKEHQNSEARCHRGHSSDLVVNLILIYFSEDLLVPGLRIDGEIPSWNRHLRVMQTGGQSLIE